jgi:hypothetical protein
MRPESAGCPRLFEVEAARDGRLTGTELARFQAHAARCRVCAQEAQALADLARALRSLPPTPCNELEHRRHRTRLLAAFDGALAPATPARGVAARFGLSAFAIAALVVLGLWSWQARHATGRATTAAVHLTPVTKNARLDAISIRAEASSDWSRHTGAGVETVTLVHGTLSIRVDHALSPPRLLIVLPDGVLEDLGTTFSVTASSSQTTHVAVEDGTILLRLRDTAPIVLHAGESRLFPPELPRSTAASSPPAPARARSPVAPKGAAARPSALPAVAAGPSALPAAADDDAGTAFRTAVTALDSGDASRAAALFAAFTGQYPRDGRGEDAAYLRVIALQRAGRTTELKRAARDYVTRYPNGFRRAEVEGLGR